ncbi:hypothetical protein ACEZDB_07995 [Streptacidiphilus sp. N1-3]|uniref:pPIWI-RE three-gene island domain-containing protein n=1 Tax=Streptacidiphilus alkalitolerans TaxID=3342712 RepID=A0ABV6WXH1_9ACTN
MTAGAAATSAPAAGAPDPGPEGVALFQELAGVVAVLGEYRGLRSFRLPYPPEAQQALDRTVLHCLAMGAPPPRSLPELLEWCRHRSATDPLFRVPASLVTPDATLVHEVGLMPTRSCLELDSHGPSGGVEREAVELMAGLEAHGGGRFRQIRAFLVRHPTVHGHDRFGGGWNRAVWALVKDLYHPLPEALVAGGTLLRCGTCRLPALLRGRAVPEQGPPFSGPDTWCEGETCPHRVRMELVRDPGQVLLLRRSLRQYLVLPGRTEAAALAALDRAGIGYESLPGLLGAYRRTGQGTHRDRVIQVYDRRQPALLADRLARTAVASGVTLVVVPEAAADTGYRDTFTLALPYGLRDRVRLTTPSELVRDVKGVDDDA